MPFTQATARQHATKSHEIRRVNPHRMVVEMQVRLHAIAIDPDADPREAAQCALAWDKLEARKAVLSGRPANTSQSIKSEPAKRNRQSDQTSPIEPLPSVESDDQGRR